MAAESHGDGFLYDAHNWVLISFIIFAIVLFRAARQKVVDGLDARSERIRHELDEAEKLRTEAQELLAQYQRKHRDAMQNAEEIISHAKEQAKRIKKDAQEEIEATIERREQQLLDRIARAEAAAVDEVRHQAADIAVAAVEKLSEDALSKGGGHLVEAAIKDIPAKLN